MEDDCAQATQSSALNPTSTAWNPYSKTVLDYLTWGLCKILTSTHFLLRSRHHLSPSNRHSTKEHRSCYNYSDSNILRNRSLAYCQAVLWESVLHYRIYSIKRSSRISAAFEMWKFNERLFESYDTWKPGLNVKILLVQTLFGKVSSIQSELILMKITTQNKEKITTSRILIL